MPSKPLPPIPLTRKQRDIVDGPQREPSSIPRVVRDQGKRLLRGRKTQRTGGGRRVLGGQPPLAELVVRGPFTTFNEGMAVHDPRPARDPAPLTDAAYRLYKLYLARASFWWSITRLQLPAEAAGELYLGVKKSQAFKAQRELQSYADDYVIAPLAWFRSQVLTGIHDGRIGRGRETDSSPWADSFFLALADGISFVAELRDRIGVRSNIDIREFHPDSRIESEVIDYLIYSRLLWRAAITDDSADDE
jgi:hypothetical protein